MTKKETLEEISETLKRIEKLLEPTAPIIYPNTPSYPANPYQPWQPNPYQPTIVWSDTTNAEEVAATIGEIFRDKDHVKVGAIYNDEGIDVSYKPKRLEGDPEPPVSDSWAARPL